jgi:excisionase family DNA binding protein
VRRRSLSNAPHHDDGVGVVPSIRTSALGLTTSQVARELGVSLGTVRRWADLGHLETYRTPGGQRRFSREQVDRFLRSLEQR